ncbi:MAG: nucleotidyl transferase AbiEii/AbiGii toxin family protein [Armatimonadetes bacterium]|nr:nucleotidyl transferase AbiEii/AbiGii toxin family protein [Armatimonadota bacterium]
MDHFLRLSQEDRRLACLQVEDRTRLQAASVEKDFWVCWTLRELFNLPNLGARITFKGGTSLSKAWQLIERFSEDIDLTVDKDALGFGGEGSLDSASSNKQRKVRLESLMTACRRWVQDELRPALEDRIIARLDVSAQWSLEVDPDTADGQCLLFHYPGVFPATEAGYVRPVVKIELGARSDDWPSHARSIQPYVADAFPELIPEAAFPVRTLAPERTFWEKAMLLHEETFRPVAKPRQARLARHYYDLWCLIRKGVADRATLDSDLFDRVAGHRSLFFRQNWVDYATLRRGSLRLVPPDDQLSEWRRDYETMRSEMFFGEVPTFAEILEVVGDFESRFNRTAAP